MTAEGTVIRIIDDTHASVKTVRKSACAECHKKSDGGCRACDIFLGSDTIEANVINKIGANVGDQVVIESSSSYVIFAAAIVFILPVLTAILSYCLFAFAFSLAEYAPLAAVAGFAVGVAAAVIYGKTEKNKERIIITKILYKDN
ncbi:MAG: SoxR reducing system RseC family protein [Clostridia bacterium]|nr:SoxR reducing system RseC family protein [Clostridia bacterium]